MIVDQSEIDALLSEADRLTAEAERISATGEPQAARRAAGAPLDLRKLPPGARRLLRIRVPLIVQLAERKMTVAAIRRLSLGTIIEFERSAEDPLDLLINNQPIGVGEAVKVNEHFGLKIEQVRPVASRIRALGE